MLRDQPQPEIARSAVILGEVHVGAGAILAQGLVVRAHGAAVSIGNYSAILENGVVIGTPEHPARVGQRTVFGHRATIVGAAIGDLCEIGNGAILMPGSRLGSGCILGEGTLVPAGTVIPADSVLVGRPPHVIRSATDADRERLAVLRQHQTNLTDHPGTVVHGPMRAGAHMGTLYAYRDKTPSIGAGTVLFDSAEITGDVVIGEQTLIGAGVKIIGDSHGPVRIGSRVQILENTVLHLLPDNALVIDDDAVIGPGAMIHGCHIGRGSIIEPGAIVCDGSGTGAESVVRAGACVKQRDRFGDRSVLDGFPARLVGTLNGPPPVPGWALPPDAVATLRRVPRLRLRGDRGQKPAENARGTWLPSHPRSSTGPYCMNAPAMSSEQHERGIHAVRASRRPGIRAPAAHRGPSGTTDIAMRRARPFTIKNKLTGMAL